MRCLNNDDIKLDNKLNQSNANWAMMNNLQKKNP